jgi:hypothetical protein
MVNGDVSVQVDIIPKIYLRYISLILFGIYAWDYPHITECWCMYFESVKCINLFVNICSKYFN